MFSYLVGSNTLDGSRIKTMVTSNWKAFAGSWLLYVVVDGDGYGERLRGRSIVKQWNHAAHEPLALALAPPNVAAAPKRASLSSTRRDVSHTHTAPPQTTPRTDRSHITVRFAQLHKNPKNISPKFSHVLGPPPRTRAPPPPPPPPPPPRSHRALWTPAAAAARRGGRRRWTWGRRCARGGDDRRRRGGRPRSPRTATSSSCSPPPSPSSSAAASRCSSAAPPSPRPPRGRRSRSRGPPPPRRGSRRPSLTPTTAGRGSPSSSARRPAQPRASPRLDRFSRSLSVTSRAAKPWVLIGCGFAGACGGGQVEVRQGRLQGARSGKPPRFATNAASEFHVLLHSMYWLIHACFVLGFRMSMLRMMRSMSRSLRRRSSPCASWQRRCHLHFLLYFWRDID